MKHISRSTQLLRHFSMSSAAQGPKIKRISPLDTSEAKWTELRKIEVNLQEGGQINI